ncbi:amino acid ABC transporter substrate-binding protein [Oceanirhabdus sp. W0125-5]|uniref:amino acid ABC transporter substrate-binding protein n=1 Tax=Oceanirhabdus sp. W0125-5 TaxID=2999116 RepID=UPI0022F32356|nr:amino acid ABC transporter substrate-binding protein [Oceanirhabdus sp. W0125-5]WBW96772.1 amino acid ABC transporter substrate-binding protein [Oceanirhabdus sp. W0125-5]
MRKSILTILMFLVVLVGITGCGSENLKGGNNSHSEETKKFVVGLDDNFPPMGFRSESGEIIGFDIDLAKEAAKRIGYEVEFKAVDWDGVLLSLNNGDIDVIWNGLTITEERKEKIGFTDEYLVNNQIIVVSGESEITTKGELKDMIIGVQMGSSSQTVIENIKDEIGIGEIKKYSNNVDALLDLKAGRIQGVVVDEVVGRYYMVKNGGSYRILEETLGGESYGVGFRKSDSDFGEELNEVLIEMKEDGTFDKIKEMWFGK